VVKHRPPPLPNKTLGDLRPDEIAILLPPDEDDDVDVKSVAVTSNKTAASKSSPNVTPLRKPSPKHVPPPINVAAITEEAKAAKEHSKNSKLVKSIVEQKRKKERKTLIVTIILSVTGAILVTLLMAYLLSPARLQQYESPTDNKITEQTTEQNIRNENPNDNSPPIELIEFTDE
jgi:hypothetical protein